MYIEKPNQELVVAEQTRQSLEFFLTQQSPEQTPPCPGCVTHFKAICSPTCPEASTALSTQPKEFPIEPNAIPLVYGLMSTRVAQTCWSCEGHMDSNQRLITLPRVSFYSSSPVYSQILHRHLSQLFIDKKISYQWNVILADYAQTWAQTYSVVPDLSLEKTEISLGKLQNDLKVIGTDLQKKLKTMARKLISEIDDWSHSKKNKLHVNKV